MTHEFKVGDKVKFLSLKEAMSGLGYPAEECMPFMGKKMTVASLQGGLVHLAELQEDCGPVGVLPRRLRPVRKVLTEQGIFDFVYRFIVRQGRPAASPAALGGCYYRARQDGAGVTRECRDGGGATMACAVGCLLSDTEARCLFETRQAGKGWIAVARESKPARFLPFESFLAELQRIHDDMPRDASFLPSFRNEMASFAALRGLTVPGDVCR